MYIEREIHMCIYIYTHTYTYIHIYIYTDIRMRRGPVAQDARGPVQVDAALLAHDLS